MHDLEIPSGFRTSEIYAVILGLFFKSSHAAIFVCSFLLLLFCAFRKFIGESLMPF